MKKIIFIFATALCFNLSSQAQSPFTSGNLVIFRAGDGDNTYNLAQTVAVPAFLDEYSIDANENLTLVQSIALPTTTIGTNKPCTTTPSSVNGGHVSLSGDGRYIVVPGFATEPGSWPIANAASSPAHNRMVALVDYNGQINSTTALDDAYSETYIRSAATKDGNGFWMAADNKTAYDDGFLRYSALGSSSSVQLAANARRVFFAFENQLYVSSDISIFQVGNEYPTTATDDILAPLFPTISGRSFYGFCMINTGNQGTQKQMYITDTKDMLIRKYSLVDGTWTANGTYALTNLVANVTPRSIQAKEVNGVVNLYVVCSHSTAANAASGRGALYLLKDNAGFNVDINVVGTPSLKLDWENTNKVMKSVVWAPSNNTQTLAKPTITESAKIYGSNGCIYIKTTAEDAINVYNTLGAVVYSNVATVEGVNEITGLKKGSVYLVKVGNNTKKIVL